MTHASITVEEIPFSTAFAVVTVTAVETSREVPGLRKLVLRRKFKVVRSWVWEVGLDSRGTVVVDDGYSAGGVTEEPGGVVGLLHGV